MTGQYFTPVYLIQVSSGCLIKTLGGGVDFKIYIMLYQGVFQAVNNNGSETWVITVTMFNDLELSHIGVSRWIFWMYISSEEDTMRVYSHS